MLEYNPIENYDRMEDWTDTDDETTSSARDNTIKSTSTNEIMNSVNITDQNTAFNAGLADHAKQITDGDTTENGSITNTEKENVNDGRTGKHTKTGRAHGNIGVTTSQQMIQSERDLVVFNLYDVIANSFIENFCLMVY